MSLAAGTRLGPFEVLALLGEGGMGAVYRARDTKLGRDVALKILPESFAGDPDRPGAAGAGERLVSTAGGIYPLWRPDGRELFYVAPDGTLTAVPIEVRGATIEPGTPVALFRPHMVGGGEATGTGRQYDVAPDGRFLINTMPEQTATPITLLQHWRPRETR